MRYMFSLLFVLSLFTVHSQSLQSLPKWNSANEKLYQKDWLVEPVHAKAGIYTTDDHRDIILYNGLVKRTFRIAPNVACIDYKNMINGQQLLRAVKPEARLIINGKQYDVGGLYGQKENAYLLPEWVDQFKTSDSSFQFISYEVNDIKPFLNWKTTMWTANKKQATGKMISFKYNSESKGSERAWSYRQL